MRILLSIVVFLSGLVMRMPLADAVTDCTPPSTVEGYERMFGAQPWQGDGNWSAPLPDGRSIMTQGDSISRVDGTWSSNVVGVVNGSCVWQTPELAPHGTWLGPVAQVGTRIVSKAIRTSDWGVSFAIMRLDAGSWIPVLERYAPSPSEPAGVSWGAGIIQLTNGYAYVWGTEDLGWGVKRAYLARVYHGVFSQLAYWRYWTPTGWVSNAALAAPVLSPVDDAFSVRYCTDGWHIYTKPGKFTTEHGEYVGSLGQWTWRHKGDALDTEYLAASHPEFQLANGKLLVTINRPSQNFVPIGPRFTEVLK